MTVDNFQVLSRMCERDQTGEFQRAYIAPDNFIEAKTGKQGWGFVKMAVDNKTIIELFTEKKTAMVLMIYDVDEFKRVKAEMGSK